MQLQAMSAEVCPPCHRSLSVASLPCIEPCRIIKKNKLTPSNRFEITKSHRCFLLSCSTFTILHHPSSSFTLLHHPSPFFIYRAIPLPLTWSYMDHVATSLRRLWNAVDTLRIMKGRPHGHAVSVIPCRAAQSIPGKALPSTAICLDAYYINCYICMQNHISINIYIHIYICILSLYNYI